MVFGVVHSQQRDPGRKCGGRSKRLNGAQDQQQRERCSPRRDQCAQAGDDESCQKHPPRAEPVSQIAGKGMSDRGPQGEDREQPG